MVNYAVSDWTSSVSDPRTVAAEIETYLETIDNTKTILVSQIVQRGSDNCQAIIIHVA
jgi:hypothetical protein